MTGDKASWKSQRCRRGLLCLGASKGRGEKRIRGNGIREGSQGKSPPYVGLRSQAGSKDNEKRGGRGTSGARRAKLIEDYFGTTARPKDRLRPVKNG